MKKNSVGKFEVEFTEISIKVKLVKGKHENLLANASVSFKGKFGEYFTISGFTVWISKFGGRCVQVPQNGNFKFCLFEKSFWKKLEEAILDSYDYESIEVPK